MRTLKSWLKAREIKYFGPKKRRFKMLKKIHLCLVCTLLAFVFSGCVARTYNLTRDRVDQDLNAGNRGYLIGTIPAEEAAKERKLTRTTRIVEIEMHSPVKVTKPPKEKTPLRTPETRIQEDYSSRDYIAQPYIPRIERTQEPQPVTSQQYTVQEGDTLQKISQKFYGTTKKWYKIYKANQETLKGPNRIYPGQVINIPTVPSGGSEKLSPGLK
jgi:LysM repeat protein